jgi:bifunctional DNA-binding transcriptional regulator/antitoxin component of YhaV-PrlF toxin-antitoxin module
MMEAQPGSIVVPLLEGRIAVPAAVRNRLGLDDLSLLQMVVVNDQIVISQLHLPSMEAARIYSGDEVADFLALDHDMPMAIEEGQP